MGNGVMNGANMGTTILSPNFTVFTGTPTFVANMRARSNAPANLAENETKLEILKRQQICLSQVSNNEYSSYQMAKTIYTWAVLVLK